MPYQVKESDDGQGKSTNTAAVGLVLLLALLVRGTLSILYSTVLGRDEESQSVDASDSHEKADPKGKQPPTRTTVRFSRPQLRHH